MWQRLKNIYHLFKAALATVRYGFPGRAMTVIGVTGTDGKTTTANLIYHLLRSNGKKTALISTVSAKIGDKEYDTGFHVSTPDGWILQSYLRKAKEAGCTHLVLEVTSHGLDQNRVFGIPFDIGVITNITREHLDYHKTMENYVKAKAKLLQRSKVAILNHDDSSYKALQPYLKGKKIITYGLTKASDVTPEKFPFKTTLPGEFNTYNSLAAITVGTILKLENIAKAIETFVPPKGRMEVVYDKDFQIIIDFAHTPNALEKLLSSLSQKKKGRLIHVFGSAGERDHGKRPLMGQASSSYADVSILTSEDPRHENVEKINQEICEGMKNAKEVREITGRQEAITYAVRLAKKHDTVVITGKGHEKSMNFNGKELPWSEHKAVEKALKNLDLKT